MPLSPRAYGPAGEPGGGPERHQPASASYRAAALRGSEGGFRFGNPGENRRGLGLRTGGGEDTPPDLAIHSPPGAGPSGQL